MRSPWLLLLRIFSFGNKLAQYVLVCDNNCMIALFSCDSLLIYVHFPHTINIALAVKCEIVGVYFASKLLVQMPGMGLLRLQCLRNL